MTVKIDTAARSLAEQSMEALRGEAAWREVVADAAWSEDRKAHHAVLECEAALKAAKARAAQTLAAAKEAEELAILWKEAAYGTR